MHTLVSGQIMCLIDLEKVTSSNYVLSSNCDLVLFSVFYVANYGTSIINGMYHLYTQTVKF